MKHHHTRQKLATNSALAGLTLGALGVVFGDIGTSPLYALQVALQTTGRYLAVSRATVLGVVSLIVWAITLTVTVKFIIFIMRADSAGEGGILALVALLKSSRLVKRYKWMLIGLGVVGVSLFYGDSLITPAISILSAMEGLRVVAPALDTIIVPTTLVIVLGLFAMQRFGTSQVGTFFGPVMVVWFAAIGLGGLWQISRDPTVLAALSPLSAVHFAVVHPLVTFVAMSAVILAVTGAEALYADMGHFGRRPIVRAWLLMVFPALALCYVGQGSMLLRSPQNIGGGALIAMYPGPLQLPMVILSAIATIIASQAVISGAFSLTKQAIQLDFLPRMLIRHTSSSQEGQIYLPFVNFLLGASVVVLVVAFRSSAHLASAYGIAVSGTLLIDSILFLAVFRSVMDHRRPLTALLGLLFLPIDLVFVVSNIPKIGHGGIFPIAVGALIFLLIDTWIRGERLVNAERKKAEGQLLPYVASIRAQRQRIKRVPGTTVFMGPHAGFAPLALHAVVEDLHELPQRVIIVSVESSPVAHVHHQTNLDHTLLGAGIEQVTLDYGYHDHVSVPLALRKAHVIGNEGEEVAYLVSLVRVIPSRRRSFALWRQQLYCFLARNAVSASDYFGLPPHHTEEMASLIRL